MDTGIHASRLYDRFSTLVGRCHYIRDCTYFFMNTYVFIYIVMHLYRLRNDYQFLINYLTRYFVSYNNISAVCTRLAIL